MGSGGASLDPVSAGIGFAGNVASGFINRKSQEEADDRNWRHTQQMWNMENEYNSPKAQMARFEEAGLNPNLMYGSISSGNSSSPSVPQSSPTRFQLDLSRYLFRKEKEKSQAELDNIALHNKILGLQAERLAYDTAYYRRLGLPTKSPALATLVALALDKSFNNPTVNDIKSDVADWAFRNSLEEENRRAEVEAGSYLGEASSDGRSVILYNPDWETLPGRKRR